MARPEYSATTEEIYEALGPVTRHDEETNWSTLHFVAALGELLHETEQWSRDTEDGPGWSGYMQVETAPAEALPWLAQMKGVRIVEGIPDTAQRQLIAEASGFARGSVGAIRKTAQAYLKGTKQVDIYERETSPYQYRVRIYLQEIAGMSYNDLAAAEPTYADVIAEYPTYDTFSSDPNRLVAALERTKPAGLVLSVTMTPGPVP